MKAEPQLEPQMVPLARRRVVCWQHTLAGTHPSRNSRGCLAGGRGSSGVRRSGCCSIGLGWEDGFTLNLSIEIGLLRKSELAPLSWGFCRKEIASYLQWCEDELITGRCLLAGTRRCSGRSPLALSLWCLGLQLLLGMVLVPTERSASPAAPLAPRCPVEEELMTVLAAAAWQPCRKSGCVFRKRVSISCSPRQ